MAKYRKKPVMIEAVQFINNRDASHVLLQAGMPEPHLPDGVIKKKFEDYQDSKPYYKYGIETLEGFMECKHLDWIITRVNRERYPCKPDIFEKTYEPVN